MTIGGIQVRRSASARSTSVRWLSAILAAIVVGAGLTPIGAQEAVAAEASEFDPGFLISDGAFYDDDAMTEAEIQSFLDSRVAQCGNDLCLERYRETTATREATPRCGRYEGAANEPASRIIFRVQQVCGISAKALLVTLQKEQGLITTGSPTDRQIRVAMGYGCPDTAPCDALYYGFFNQVYTASSQFQRYRMNPGGYRHPVGVPFEVYLHPASNPLISNPPRCGTQKIVIRNLATAGLYNYTPYAPNASALSNLYGTGDSCASYGNRNFWRYFTDWFGDPRMYPVEASASRIDGADRYQVAANLATTAYTSASTVYVASGQNFPDGLVSAPAAARVSAPLLLTDPSSLPGSTIDAIRTLKPTRVVVVGGEASVSAYAYAQLESLVGAGGVRRDAGADRYSASIEIARGGFTSAKTVYLANGENFPDALSTSAAAGAAGAPILLVRPWDTQLDPAAVELLRSLGTTSVVIAGGSSSVSSALESWLRSSGIVASVARQQGADRYSAGLAVNKAAFPTATSAFIASGQNFPDAMAGAAVAAARRAPLLLTLGTCTPIETLAYLNDAGVSSVTFLGGTSTISSRASRFESCS